MSGFYGDWRWRALYSRTRGGMAVAKRDRIDGKICSSCLTWNPLAEFRADRTHGDTQGGLCRRKVSYRARRVIDRKQVGDASLNA